MLHGLGVFILFPWNRKTKKWKFISGHIVLVQFKKAWKRGPEPSLYNNKKLKVIKQLQTIVGVGHRIAFQLVKKGVTSIKDLKQKINNKEIIVNNTIKLGIKYYGKFHGNIPRSEIDEINILINEIIASMNKQYNLTKHNKYIYEICGSYRRKKLFCGDIDILFSKKDSQVVDPKIISNSINPITNHLHMFIDRLKVPNVSNNNKPLVIDDITNTKITTKYMGFLKYKNNLVRRIDIRFVPYKYYYSALLYFTGSREFNRNIRKIAKSKGYKLSEYGLTRIIGKSQYESTIPIKSEKDIFNILNIPYLEPEYRT